MKARLLFVLAVIVVGGAYARTLRATPSSGFSATTLATARFDEIDLNASTLPTPFWQAKLKTKGLSDLYVQSNLWTPGGTTGWHTHPGPSLITVTSGAVTTYEGDDPSCTPHVYLAGAGFIDPGDGHVHIIRNEGAVDARTVAVQLVPAAAARRIDVPAPGNCAF